MYPILLLLSLKLAVQKESISIELYTYVIILYSELYKRLNELEDRDAKIWKKMFAFKPLKRVEGSIQK